jgi:hypothetical protein
MRWFLFTSGLLLLGTGGAKIISAMGHAKALKSIDPVFQITFRQLFLIAGLIELGAACICILSKHVHLRAGIVFCLSIIFVVYRLGLMWLGYHGTCHCMGRLTDALHLSPAFADMIMQIVLAYLLVGSITILSTRIASSAADTTSDINHEMARKSLI